ncbi:MAG: AbrB/MazE/SpoVT family DNA-binding domain-containing protein [Chloroflexi bacterium]|nr:AbrB/MazE/SpoVT family DNA-binding domain-containing protein [Chloroflexota bacterium]
MKELFAIVNSKGQVTIPVEIRRLLRLKPHDKVVFVVEGDQVRLLLVESVVARTAGMLKSDESSLSATELREVAEEAFAAEATERGGR